MLLEVLHTSPMGKMYDLIMSGLRTKMIRTVADMLKQGCRLMCTAATMSMNVTVAFDISHELAIPCSADVIIAHDAE